jgi:hypothetical protein
MNRPAPRRSGLLFGLVALLAVTGVLSLGSVVQIHDGFEHAEIGRHHIARDAVHPSARVDSPHVAVI